MLLSQITRRNIARLGSLACLAGLLGLVFSMAIDKDISLIARIALVAFGLVVVVATLVAQTGPDQQNVVQTIRQPPFLAGMVLAVFAGFSALTDMANLFSPRPAVESAPGVIEDITSDTNRRLRILAPDRPPIAQAIEGRWGETRACEVAYRIAVKNKAVRITREAASLAPYSLTGTIIGEESHRLMVVVQTPDKSRGQMLDISLFDDGMTKQLVWDDLSMSVPLKLDQCSPAR